MIHQLFNRFMVRGVMTLFWFLIICCFLYAPTMKFFENKKTITVLTWTDLIDPELLSKFEATTGITVKLRFFENNEELFIKLLAGRGEGFDLVIPSDYVIEKLIQNRLIKPIDRTKLNFWQRLNPHLLNPYYDPENKYTIPYHWAVYGLGVRNDAFTQPPTPSWKLIFDSAGPGKVTMLNSAREGIALAAYYLFGTVEQLSSEQQRDVYSLLFEQRKRVEAYVDGDVRADYLLRSKQCSVAVMGSAFIVETLKSDSAINFIIPQEGSFLVVDSLVIAANTHRDNEVYQFINFLFEEKILKHHFDKYPFIPATQELIPFLQNVNAPQQLISAYQQNVDQLHFFRQLMSEDTINELWMAIKL